MRSMKNKPVKISALLKCPASHSYGGKGGQSSASLVWPFVIFLPLATGLVWPNSLAGTIIY